VSDHLPSSGAVDAAERMTAGSNLGASIPLRRLYALFILALALRAGYGGVQVWRSGDAAGLTFPDEQQYWQMSRELRGGGRLTDELGFQATRMPLFPWWLALFPESAGGVASAKVCQWIIGALVAPLVALLGARVFERQVGLVAGVVAAADPALVGLSSLLLTETWFVFVLVFLWWVSWPLTRTCLPVPTSSGREGMPPPSGIQPRADEDRTWWRWVVTGALSALCVYVRPSSAGLIVVWTVVLVVRQGLREARAWAGAAIILCIVIVALLPWAARNQRVTGHWCWLTHRAGISLYDGVGPQATGASDLGTVKSMPAVAELDEVAWNNWFLRASWESVRSDPARIVRLAGVKLARTWSPVLHADELRSPGVRVVFAAWSTGLFALAVVGIVALRRRLGVVTALLVPALYLSALHAVFVGSVRYRAGAIPALAVLAALAVVTLTRRRGAA
jgi:hypothetical protein